MFFKHRTKYFAHRKNYFKNDLQVAHLVNTNECSLGASVDSDLVGLGCRSIALLPTSPSQIRISPWILIDLFEDLLSVTAPSLAPNLTWAGFSLSQIRDVISLCSTDFGPGLLGVSVTRATQLIQNFQNLDNIFVFLKYESSNNQALSLNQLVHRALSYNGPIPFPTSLSREARKLLKTEEKAVFFARQNFVSPVVSSLSGFRRHLENNEEVVFIDDLLDSIVGTV